MTSRSLGMDRASSDTLLRLINQFLDVFGRESVPQLLRFGNDVRFGAGMEDALDVQDGCLVLV